MVKVVFCFRDSARALAPSPPILFAGNEQGMSKHAQIVSLIPSPNREERFPKF